MDSRRPPAIARAGRGRHTVFIELGDDASHGRASDKLLEDPNDDGSLGRLDVHRVALRALATSLVDTDRTVRARRVPARLLTDEIAALFLSELTTEGLLAQIPDEQLVDGAAILNKEGRFLVSRVEAIGNGDDPDAVKMKIREQAQHVRVVTGKTRQLIDDDDTELALLYGSAQRQEAGAIM